MIRLLWIQAKQATSVVRLKPFETFTTEGRSKERYRRAALTVLASVAAKGISILTVLISVPLTVGYLGAERYGLWMTISSVVAMLVFADMGMGNGLLNAVSEANGRDDREAARRYVSSAFFMLSGVAAVVGGVFLILYPFISWQGLFNVASGAAVKESGPAMAVFIACFVVNIPLGIVQRIQAGYQEGFLNDLWAGFGSLLGLGGVLSAVYLESGLPWLVLAMAGAPALASLLNGVVLFGFKRPWLRPRWKGVTGDAAGKVFQTGILFFVLQAAMALAFFSDNLVAAQILGPEAVTQYSVPFRLFGVVPMILGAVLSPLWPAYGESIARGDLTWVKKTLTRSMAMTLLVAGAVSVSLVLFGVPLIHLWVGPKITPPFFLMLGLGVWTVMAAAGNALAVFLNGVNVIRFQAVCAVFMAVCAVIAKIFLARAIGVSGIIWGTVIAYALFTAIPIALYLPGLLSTLRPAVAAPARRQIPEERGC